jgi:glycerophosphoryl diester phosphodiesterase
LSNLGRPIGFAHRGAARSRREQNTLSAFERALALGAQGFETDISLTADGVPVLLHPRVLPWLRLPIARLRRDDLPDSIPTLADLYNRCGADFELSLDMAHPQAADAVVRIAEQHGAVDRLWLTYWRLPTLQSWRERWPRVHLVYPTIPAGRHRADRLVAQLADMGVDALNVHHRFCSAGLVKRAHDAGLLVFAWGVRSERPLRRVMAFGIDGAYCDDVAAMVRVVNEQNRDALMTPGERILP